MEYLSAHETVSCWLRHGQGMVGIGSAYSQTFGNAAEVEDWWQDLTSQVEVDNECPDLPMSGPIAFISFPFAVQGSYEVIVPRVILGRSGGKSWVTTWNQEWIPQKQTIDSYTSSLTFCEGHTTRDQWIDAVNQAVTTINNHQIDKVVLARDEVAALEVPIDLRHVLSRLSEAYPQTWTFCVKNLVGASPELLIRQDRGLITSRVLAGTIHGDHDPASLAEALSSSSKDLAEHEFAVSSVAEALGPHCTSLHVPEMPFVLSLPNVMHLASDISGAVRPGSTVVGLASIIHPSAAVCGTPTQEARHVIAELEHMDRGRYAGPVGWVNAHGDGEIALALRCGIFDGTHVRIFAGCGIVADSNPEAEWDETVAKLKPMKQALGVG